MDVVSVSPIFNLYDRNWPMRTRQRQYPPAKFVFGEPGRTGMAVNSIVSQGCIVSGAVVRNSVLSQDVRVNSYAEMDSSIIFTHVDIGRHCRIKRAIIDRDVHLPEGTVIGYDQAEDKRHYFVTPSGLTVVTRDGSLYRESGRTGLSAALLIALTMEPFAPARRALSAPGRLTRGGGRVGDRG